MKTLYEEGLAAGLAEGEAKGRAAGLADGAQAFGQTLLQCIGRRWQVPEELRRKIQEEESLETLQSWLGLAWEAQTLEELAEKIFKTKR